MTHEWSGAPGLYCLRCNNDSPLESALVCPNCRWSEPDETGNDTKHEPCEFHGRWIEALETCPPDPEKVKRVLGLIP